MVHYNRSPNSLHIVFTVKKDVVRFDTDAGPKGATPIKGSTPAIAIGKITAHFQNHYDKITTEIIGGK